ncbi:MAG: Spo0B domain-containing protein [Syntrophomonadaceae bacterium]|nr:Spo0B domain-containing protein [Syntrophomonadaceae bacterium]
MTDDQMVDLLRRTRHDFDNHLQVISGYLDLAKPEEAQKYLKQIVAELATERIIFESCSGEAALYFYDQLIRARDIGIAIKYHRLQVNNINHLQTHDEPFNSLKEAAARYNHRGDNLKVNVTVIEEENSSLIVDVAVEDIE